MSIKGYFLLQLFKNSAVFQMSWHKLAFSWKVKAIIKQLHIFRIEYWMLYWALKVTVVLSHTFKQ